MPNPGYREEDHKKRKDAVEKALCEGSKPKGIISKRDGVDRSALEVAAERLGIDRNTMYSWANKVEGTQWEPNWGLFLNPDDQGGEIEGIESPQYRRDLRDSAFWRKRAMQLQEQLADVEHIADQLAGVRNQKIEIPNWLVEKSEGKQGRAILGVFLSDIHAGEVVDAEEIGGLNEYNIEICRRRLRRLFSAACNIGPRWLSDCRCQGVLLALGGDLISGSIHEELRITNELTSHEQVRFVVEEISAGIRCLSEKFGRVHVASVPGNHGRTTLKDTAKQYSRLNYDTLAADMIAAQFKDDKRVTFQIGHSTDQILSVFGFTGHLTHGHKSGTGGGQGFAGPDLPIVRGGKKVAAQQASVGRRIDFQLTAHKHYSTNPGKILSNGSIPGLTEYSADLRVEIEPPKQWLFVIHEKWCLRERMDVQLEDPPLPEKPVVRVPAWSAPR